MPSLLDISSGEPGYFKDFLRHLKGTIVFVLVLLLLRWVIYPLILKIFERKEKYKPSQELMAEDRFWAIIQISQKRSEGNYAAQQSELARILQALPLQELIEFDNRRHQLHTLAYDWQLWGAIYIVNGGCSDDHFMDFRNWLIAQGEDFYYRTLKDPEYLVHTAPGLINVEWEGFASVVQEIFEARSGKRMPVTYMQDCPIKGIPWNDEEGDLEKRFPSLSAKYNNNYWQKRDGAE